MLPLAIPDGRTSELAAVRSDARPDRATADTNGIVGAGQAVWESVYRGLSRGKERYCKTEAEYGAVWLSRCGSSNVGGAPDEGHFTRLRTGGMGVEFNEVSR
jgi:hypothetical protein